MAWSAADRDRRLRTLRNLAESAFIDRKRMAEYVGTVERLMLQGTLEKRPGLQRRVDRRRGGEVEVRRRAP